MALQTSGAISLDDIQTEFGGSNPISLSEYYGAAAGIPASGTISLSDFYGASASQFKIITYSGNSSTQSITVGFAPDMVIVKRRSGVGSNGLFDTIRGDYKGLYTNETAGEYATNTNTVALTSTGFSLGGASLTLNTTGNNYVAWCWQAGGTAVSNTDGNITSTVSANPDLGFSIVKWTSNGTSTSSVGHGLGIVPEVVIHKKLVGTTSWLVMVTGTSNTAGLIGGNATLASGGYGYGFLSANNAISTSPFSTFASTSSVFKQFISNTSGYVYMAYCFASVPGVCKVGQYTGNGGTKAITGLGFEPSFLILKRASDTSNWLVLDNARDTTDPRSVALFLDLNIAELNSSTYNTSFDSDGFTLTGTSGNLNTNGAGYLYIAFA